MAIYINTKWNYSLLDLSEYCEELHAEFTGIIISNLNLIVVTMYHSPSGSFERFFYLLDMCLVYLTSLGLDIIIGTDHNVNILNHPSEASDFRNILRSHDIFFSVNEPTRGLSPLDTVLTNLDSWRYMAHVSVDQISDHKHVFFKLDLPEGVSKHGLQEPDYLNNPVKTVTYRQFNESNYCYFQCVLTDLAVKWLSEIESFNAEQSFDYFFDKFRKVFDYCFPLRNKTCRTVPPAKANAGCSVNNWYTPELSAFKNFILGISDLCKSNPQLLPYLRDLRKHYRLKVREAKQFATATAIATSPNACKAAWNYINRHKTPTTVPAKDFCTADEFNSYFLDSVDELILSCKPDPSVPYDCLNSVPFVPTNFSWTPVTVDKLLRVVSSFKSSKSQDFYNMSVELLKRCIYVVAPIIVDIVNKSLREGVFPEALKISRTVPVYKKGPKDSTVSYRPISIIPIFGKVLEAVMLEQLYSYFERHRLIVPAQFGFQKGKSTVQAVDCLVQEILNGLEIRNSTSVIMCDLSRAFDCVSHSLLLSKLERYGVRGDALSLIKSYLEGRSQVVTWNGNSSSPLMVNNGVPQGSIMGPFLFVISINDLYHSVAGNVLLYADDTTLFSSHSDFSVSKVAVQELLDVASIWFRNNKLCLNQAKTQNITFSLSRELRKENTVKLLGFTLDPQLDWNDHIEILCGKLSRVIHLLRRLKADMPFEFVRLAYFAFFHAHILYGTRLWGHSPGVQKVLKLQKKAVRVLCGVHQLEHCKPLFVQHGIMPVHNVFIYQCLLEIKNNESAFPLVNNVHHYSTRNNENIFRDRVRLDLTLNCFPVAGIRFYNALPITVRQLLPNKFATTLKAWMLANPFYSIKEFWNAQLVTIGLNPQ